LLSVAAAQAKPDFDIAENGARAGEAVHFSIADLTGSVSYEIEVADRDVLKGSSAGSVVFSTFTMPDLGDKSRSVTVEAEIRDAKKKQKVKEKLQYLGRTPAVRDDDDDVVKSPPAPQLPSPEPEAAPQTHTPAAAPVAAVPAAPAPPAVTHLPLRRPASSGKARGMRKNKSRKHRKKTDSHRAVRRRPHRRRGKHHSSRRSGGAKLGKSRVRIPLPRTAPLFEGVPEPGAGRHRPGTRGAGGNPATPPAAALVAARTAQGDDTGVSAAVMVPALLGLAALALAGMTVLRRRSTSRRG
jgi:hypothetical protein